MPDHRAIDDLFREHRPMLLGVAYRVLGNIWDAEDAVQDSWFRLQRADLSEVRDMRAWLATLVARASIDALRRRSASEVWSDEELETIQDDRVDLEEAALREEQIGVAFSVVLRELSPLDRVSLLLHDVFGVGFDEIAAIIGAAPTAARQRASRARRRLRGVDLDAVQEAQRRDVQAFLAAARDGDIDTLLRVLAPEVTLHADAGSIALARPYAQAGGPLLAPEVHGAEAVSTTFARRIAHAEITWVLGMPAIGYRRGRDIIALYIFDIAADRIRGIDALAGSELFSSALRA